MGTRAIIAEDFLARMHALCMVVGEQPTRLIVDYDS